MRKAIILTFSLLLAVLTLFLFISDTLLAGRDSPHNRTWNVLVPVSCTNCHVPKGGTGPSLTKYENPALCMVCHTGAGIAPAKSFTGSDQANWASLTGTSHRWDTTLPDTMDPNSAYGLRAWWDLQSSYLYDSYSQIQSVACSTCHDQHVQYRTGTETTSDRDRNPWDPFSHSYNGINGSGDSGMTTVSGSTTKIIALDRTPTWTTNAWTNFYVKMTSGDNKGAIRQISGNDRTSLTVSSAFSTIVAGGVRYEIIPRHFQRITNDRNEMCEDCHYYRVASSVTTFTGNYQSHPVQKIFSSALGETPDVKNSNQFNTAPLEPVYSSMGTTVAAQTGTRYRDNGGTDTNFSNNIILDADGKVRCLSCHRVHWGYSDATMRNLPHPNEE